MKIIAATGLAAAFALTAASVASAKDYDDILKDRGIYVYENGGPFPYSSYNQAPGYEQQARVVNHGKVRHYNVPVQTNNDDPDRW